MGCGGIARQRSADDWLTLASSGLSGQDQYSYKGQVDYGFVHSINQSSRNFNGEVRTHHEYSLNSSTVDPFMLHPSQYLEIVTEEGHNAKMISAAYEESLNKYVVKLQISGNQELTTNRWKKIFEQQLNNTAIEFKSMNVGMRKRQEINKLLHESQQQLHQILGTLTVNTEYEIWIDARDAIPLKIIEKADLKYLRAGKPLEEYRQTIIALQH